MLGSTQFTPNLATWMCVCVHHDIAYRCSNTHASDLERMNVCMKYQSINIGDIIESIVSHTDIIHKHKYVTHRHFIYRSYQYIYIYILVSIR